MTGSPAAMASIITVGRLSMAPSSARAQARTNIRERSSSRLISPSGFRTRDLHAVLNSKQCGLLLQTYLKRTVADDLAFKVSQLKP